MNFIGDLIAPYTDTVIAAADQATPEQLALASVCGVVGLYVVLTSFLFPAAVAFFIAGTVYGLYAAPAATACTSLVVVLLYGWYTYWVFKEWEKAFAGQRLTRGNNACPSNQQMPDVKSFQANKSHILDNSKYHKNFDTCELLHDLENMQMTKKDNVEFRKRAARLGTLTAAQAQLEQENLEEEAQGNLSNVKAKELDMDHVFVKFTDFLWAFTCIGPFSYMLWLRGTIVLRVRKFLFKLGVIHPKCDYEELAANLVLEQSQVIHYYARTGTGSKLGNIAGFFFADFPYVDSNCNMQIANLFAVDIDLDTKRFVKAKLDNEVLNAKEAVILLWFNTIAAQHVKLHSMANWGLNLDDSLEKVNPFLRQNSVVTVMYNFFGYTRFNGFMKIWTKQGLVSEGWTHPKAPLLKCFNRGIKDGVWQHGNLDEMAKYSRFVRFAIKVRAIFLAEFQKHKHLFPGVNGEAMFVGTILHSLDHTMMDWNLKDALYLDTTDNRFGKMAELGQVVKVGFVSDVDGLYFHKRFKGSGHPFYDAVYKKAAKIDKQLADHMDTCIIK